MTALKRIIVVLGMHRSGTSAITRGLNVLGVDLGERLMPPIEGVNDKGFFEDLDFYALNIEILQAIGSDWHYLSSIEPRDVETLHQQGYFLRAVHLLRQKTANIPIFGFKDPRVAKLLPFWQSVFTHCGFDIGYVLAIRNPLNIALSLAKRDGFSHEKSYMLWLGHTLTSIAHTEAHPRVLVDYDLLLDAPQKTITLIANQLDLSINTLALQTYQSEFLERGLRHSFYTISDLRHDQACPPLAQELYAALLEVAQDGTQINKPEFLTRTQAWVNEFDRLKSNLRFADQLAAQIDHLNQSIAMRDSEITSIIKFALQQDQSIFQKIFDAEWYVKRYPDIDPAVVDPYQHYIHYGIMEGRLPAADLAGFVRNGLQVRLSELQAQYNQAQQQVETQHIQITEQEKTHAEHEQNLSKQLQAIHQELHHLELAHTQREQEFVTQLHTIQQQSDADKGELSQQYQTQIEEIQRQRAEQEKLAAERIQTLNQLIHQLQTEQFTREQTHTADVTALHRELTTLAQVQAQREQEFVTQLHAIHQQADAEKSELSQLHQAQIEEIQRQRAEHEWLSAERIQSLNQQIHQLQTEQITREQTHTADLTALRCELTTLAQVQAQREQEFVTQLHAIQQQTDAEKSELSQLHQAQTEASQRKHAELEQILDSQLRAKQDELTELSQHGLEAQQRYTQSVNQLKQQLQTMRTSYSWRWTAPLRSFAQLFIKSDASLQADQHDNIDVVPCTPSLDQDGTVINPPQSSSQIDIYEQFTLPGSTSTLKLNMSANQKLRIAQSVNELLSYYDEEFVHCAYKTLLGRAPDAEGFSYYLARIRAGISKIEILAQFRLGTEGKLRRVKLAGLDKAIRRHKLLKTPLLGSVLRFIGVKSAEGYSEQNLRAIENKLHAIDTQFQYHLSKFDKSLYRFEGLIRDHEQKISKINEQVSNLQSIAVTHSEIETNKNSFTPPIEKKIQHEKLTVSSSQVNDIKASVIILTKNPGTIFREVLLAVLKQETPWLYEVLVVDSGSSDGTIEFIRQYPTVRLLEIEPNEFGHGRTRNFAVSQAKGQYVAMLTHDAKPLNFNWLLNLVTPLEADSAIAGVFGRHKAYLGHSPYVKRDIEMHFNGFLQWPIVMGIEDPERYAREQGYRQVLHYFSDNNACLRKEIWEKIPYPDVNFAEDQLWAKAIIEAGYKRAYADDAIVFHSHDYSIKDTFRRAFDESRALKSLFGYDLCPSKRYGINQVYACTKSDLDYLSGLPRLDRSLGLKFKTPFLHMAKQSGFYIGRYEGRLKGFFFWLFSLDGAKKRKTNMSLNKKIISLFWGGKSERSANSPPETTQPALNNKIDVIGFYDFVLTEDAGILQTKTDSIEIKTINWFIPDFGIGSGGHLNIFRYISMLEEMGYKNTICIVGNHRHTSPAEASAMIAEYFFHLRANVVFGTENLPAAYYSFATSWITAYALKGFGKTYHKLYFVQDFEPAFYSHGSEYDFAEETYKLGFTGICSGGWLSRMLESNYGMKCYSIGFSYDRDLYKQTPRREPDKQRVFCYIRPPTIRRGLESALLSLKLVGERMHDVEFIFAGWDMSGYHFPYPHLNAGVCSLKELPDLYSQCDVALVFSFTNLSLLPLELMACGCVVVSNRGPNTEWLLNDNNSILPISSSPRSISDAIIKALLNTPYRIALAEQAKTFANSTNWVTEGEKLACILNELDQLNPA